jgi:integrase
VAAVATPHRASPSPAAWLAAPVRACPASRCRAASGYELRRVIARAVEWRRLSSNPALPVRKIANPRPRAVRPLSPASVEKVRAHLLVKGRLRDAALVAVLAYAGLRPGEALALTWGDIGVRTILIEKATSLGELQGTKTGRTRSVVLLKPLAADLAEWRLAAGRPAADALVFPTRDGELWQRHHWQNWRRRIYAEAATAAGISDPRPYDLRHSFCSLLLAEGKGPLEVAEQLGHSPLMTLQTYGHVIDELRGRKKVSAEAEIRKARESSVPQKAPNAAEGGAQRLTCNGQKVARLQVLCGVERTGIEPVTSGLQSRRSPS